jgi:hypothetical protein
VATGAFGSGAHPQPATADWHYFARQWRMASEAAAAVIEAVAVEEARFSEDRPARARRITAALKTALAAAPDSPNVWSLRIEDINNRGACENDSLADTYFEHPWAAKQYFARRSRGCFPNDLPRRTIPASKVRPSISS